MLVQPGGDDASTAVQINQICVWLEPCGQVLADGHNGGPVRASGHEDGRSLGVRYPSAHVPRWLGGHPPMDVQ